jgi:hypothetical protein
MNEESEKIIGKQEFFRLLEQIRPKLRITRASFDRLIQEGYFHPPPYRVSEAGRFAQKYYGFRKPRKAFDFPLSKRYIRWLKSVKRRGIHYRFLIKPGDYSRDEDGHIVVEPDWVEVEFDDKASKDDKRYILSHLRQTARRGDIITSVKQTRRRARPNRERDRQWYEAHKAGKTIGQLAYEEGGGQRTYWRIKAAIRRYNS